MSKFVLSGVGLLLLTLGGSIVGIILSHLLAPQSAAATLVGLFMLPGSLVLGLSLWRGFAKLRSLFRLLQGAVGSRPLAQALAEEAQKERPGGQIVLVFTSGGVGIAGGLIMAMLSQQHTLAIIGGYMGLGLIYGVIGFLLAGKGLFDELLWKEWP